MANPEPFNIFETHPAQQRFSSRIIRTLTCVLVCALPMSVVAQQSSTHAFTDNMTVSEFQRAGLNKLTTEELSALNAWIAKLLIVGSVSPPTHHTVDSEADSDGTINLFGGTGSASAYIVPSEGNAIYLWTGKPVAYLDSDNIYGFNGKHLGWFDDGRIYDHKGRIVGATASASDMQLKAVPAKPFRQFSPFKAFEEFAPFKPFYQTGWSDVPLGVFLAQGR